MSKESAMWGFVIVPAFIVWTLLWRVAFELAGLNPSVYTGARGILMLALSVVSTVVTVIVAYENSPKVSP